MSNKTKTCDTICKEILTNFSKISELALTEIKPNAINISKFIMTTRVDPDYNAVSITDGNFTISMAKQLAEENELKITIAMTKFIYQSFSNYIESIIDESSKSNQNEINEIIELMESLCLELHELVKEKLA